MTQYPKLDYFFFDIPVYRCSQDKHSAEMDSEKCRFLGRLQRTSTAEINDDLERLFDREVSYPWRFNDIIGWIRLFVLGPQLRGELWWNRTTRQVKRGRKRFSFDGEAFELNLLNVNDSTEIVRLILERLNSLNRHFLFKGRYIDLSLFMNLSPYINWQSLMQSQ
jgi:hypothetical protein